MERAEFEQLVIDVVEGLPPEFARRLENVEFIVETTPSPDQLGRVGMRHGTLYGLYEGVPLTERIGSQPILPSIITIFQEPLERDFRFAGELRKQVRRTVLHELAHLFGISDERLRDLGAY